MPSSNIKLFDEGKANLLSDADYTSNAQRTNGVQTGIASSQLQNKFAYQVSLVCYSIAQLIVSNGYDANDTQAVSDFINNLNLTVVQKVKDRASHNDMVTATNAWKWVSPAMVKDYVDFIIATNDEAIAGTLNTKLITPATLQAKLDNISSSFAPSYTYSDQDITAGTTPLETGKLYLVYE